MRRLAPTLGITNPPYALACGPGRTQITSFLEDQMTLKQTIENHPVIIYIGAMIIGFLAYEGGLRFLGRSTVSAADMEKIKNYDALQLELTGLKKQPLSGSVKVELDWLRATPSKECPNPAFPIQVVEKYRLDTEGSPSSFLMIGGEQTASREVRKPNETGIFAVDPSRRGWIISYCIGAGQETEGTRRFLNLDSGQSSPAIPIKVRT